MEKCVRSIDLPRLPVNPVMNHIVSNVSRNRGPGKPVRAFGRSPAAIICSFRPRDNDRGVAKERSFNWVLQELMEISL